MIGSECCSIAGTPACGDRDKKPEKNFILLMLNHASLTGIVEKYGCMCLVPWHCTVTMKCQCNNNGVCQYTRLIPCSH